MFVGDGESTLAPFVADATHQGRHHVIDEIRQTMSCDGEPQHSVETRSIEPPRMRHRGLDASRVRLGDGSRLIDASREVVFRNEVRELF